MHAALQNLQIIYLCLGGYTCTSVHTCSSVSCASTDIHARMCTHVARSGCARLSHALVSFQNQNDMPRLQQTTIDLQQHMLEEQVRGQYLYVIILRSHWPLFLMHFIVFSLPWANAIFQYFSDGIWTNFPLFTKSRHHQRNVHTDRASTPTIVFQGGWTCRGLRRQTICVCMRQ
jgi:hypothetical protein